MKIVCCLGNPGPEYVRTRHNVGFRVGEQLIERFGFDKVGNKFKSVVFSGMIGTEKVMLLFPVTFMNLSGEALQAAVAFYKLSLDDVLVVYDDFDIPFSESRLRLKGSAGTHNGMKSVVQCMGTNDVPRLRVGLGPLPEKWVVNDFVLSNFSNDEEDALPGILNRCGDVLEKVCMEPIDKAMIFANTKRK